MTSAHNVNHLCLEPFAHACDSSFSLNPLVRLACVEVLRSQHQGDLRAVDPLPVDGCRGADLLDGLLDPPSPLRLRRTPRPTHDISEGSQYIRTSERDEPIEGLLPDAIIGVSQR